MIRRYFLVVLGSVLAAPLAIVRAQTRVRVIGWLWDRDPEPQNQEAFRAGMRELGYVEGKDYQIASRSSGNDLDRLPGLAVELVTLKVDLILTTGTASAIAARKANREIPIVAPATGDPVGTGLAASLSRPGGNITGLTNLAAELYPKRVDLIRQLFPTVRRVGFLYNAGNPADQVGLKQFESACKSLNLSPAPATVRNAGEIGGAFAKFSREKVEGVVVSNSLGGLRPTIVEQAAKSRLPAVYGASTWAEAGGFISYAPNVQDLYRRASRYVDRIFKGAKPGDLPIEQPTRFELVVNLKTAHALGIKVPQAILLQADRVIE